MKHLQITEEMMKNAKTYMPLILKETLSKFIALQCTYTLNAPEGNVMANKVLSIPGIKAENPITKSIFLSTTLLSHYFDIVLDDSKPEEQTKSDEKDAIQNKYAVADHVPLNIILNQIERFKSNKELKEKAYEILSDFKEFKKAVDIEIYNIRENNNAAIMRVLDAIQHIFTPEQMQQFSGKLTDTINKMNDAMKEDDTK